MFVETLDFEVVTEGERIPLDRERHDALPADARRLASRDGMSAIYIPIDAPRVGAMPAGAAAKEIGNVMEGEFLMLLTNRDCNQLHIIHSDLSGRRPCLRRMVVHKGEKRRTVVQQIANMWDDYGRKGVPLVDAMQAAFNVGPVTRAFFADYKRVSDNAKCKITGFANDERRHLFTKTLFNRLMFIHFV